MRRIPCMGVAIGCLLSSPALAAVGGQFVVLEQVKGQIAINRGQGYQGVAQITQANPGDMVMASPNSSGKITYEDGCVVDVKPEAVVAVQAQSPCKTGRFGVRPGYLIVGALVVGGVAGGLALLAGGDDNKKTAGDKPASP